jgi:hypothetical protein
MAEQEDMKCKRILLTAREKQGIVNYCLERRELEIFSYLMAETKD